MHKPNKLEPGQIWLNMAGNPLLVVQQTNGTKLSIVVLQGYSEDKDKHHVPFVIAGFDPPETLHAAQHFAWEYVGMLGGNE